ncbi:EscU/YscU/HrcU family type III secretion system export apparatus switch protein [Persicimonas caeni]|uniref:EscU/YscU/HrcU family type III secretion system export apparatus switch protein n=1 Tax=Persicimonas caeni TaxID=2292766 RepID=A0A4Y6PTK1_PERCE|nr:EscU/YscU/HrcU family type III secretion system export apparatus switch protein [Persicimonas caeni]QDG51654.1 EscU/YscU/HrcU family type III secretion system export apparatus switch protein [Persicimonas caeni]QED32875.1 EscU/YscU/HrcU family type III secretion system export apparatus switch protein [Persicimonas caeni]
MSEKSEKPTAKRRRKAREEGNVAKSAEFTGAMVMLFAGAALAFWMTEIVRRSAGLVVESIGLISSRDPTSADIGPFMMAALVELSWMIAPVLAVGFVAAGFFNYVQIGALFTMDPLIPKGERLNPAAGLKRLVEPKKLVDLAKNVGKLSVSGVLGYFVIGDKLGVLVQLPRMGLWQSMEVLGTVAFDLCAYLGGALVVFGVIDLLWQRHKHEKSLMMSKDEVKREHKESQGDPQIKSKRKQFHRELLKDTGIKNVKKADAVVVNPTHVAVALRYEEESMGAPQVVSAGRGELARQIKKIARRHGIPTIRNVELARALVDLDVDHEIPAEFYEPVAEVLSYVYKLRRE